ALLPAATLLLPPGQQLPWVLLGTGLQSSTPVVAVIALQAALFAAVLVPVQQGPAVSRVACAWLLLAQCALAVTLLAQELLFVVTGFTAASYALLAARMAAANTQSPRLAPVAVVLVLGDLAAFELALLFAKAADNALRPAVAIAAENIGSSTVIAAFALMAAASRGALLLLASVSRQAALPMLALLLGVAGLGWRLQGAIGAWAALVAVLVGAAITFALDWLQAGFRTFPQRASRQVPPLAAAPPDAWAGARFARLQGALARVEALLGQWAAAVTVLVLVMLVLLAAMTTQAQ
ncbi:MAG: hypothetical protein V2J89_17505, partial [Halieaceae bacterium]|nr:hypothetical protein [Halieaceae bacterium]